MKILEANYTRYIMEYRGIQFIAERIETGVEVSEGFDNLAAATNTHPEDLFDLVVETIFDKEAKCQR